MRLSSRKNVRARLEWVDVDQRVSRQPSVRQLGEETLLEAVEHAESVGLTNRSEVVRVCDLSWSRPHGNDVPAMLRRYSRQGLRSALDHDSFASFIVVNNDALAQDFFDR